MQEQQQQLLAQMRQQLATCPRPTRKSWPTTRRRARRKSGAASCAKLLAEIERRINEENARPKKRYISPATREEVYAVYYDALRRKIEDKGTENFPEYRAQAVWRADDERHRRTTTGACSTPRSCRAPAASGCWTARHGHRARAAPFGLQCPAMRKPGRPDRHGGALPLHARRRPGNQSRSP
jgi:hypothetical protein